MFTWILHACIINFFFISTFILSKPKLSATPPIMWGKSFFIWNYALVSSSDKGLNNKGPKEHFAKQPKFNPSAYANLRSGDIVWLECAFLPEFYKQIVPKLKAPIVLLVAGGDESFPSECGKDFDIENLLSHEHIIHVFAQNCDYNGPSPKVTHIPIGIDFHAIAYTGTSGRWGELGSPEEQEKKLIDIIKKLKPTDQRKIGAFIDFHLSDTMRGCLNRYLKCGGEGRKEIFEIITKACGQHLEHSNSFMKRSTLWKKKGEYAFSISPHGNGLDCHRTWEDLTLGCIVIVKTSPLDKLYEGLPVIIVNDWSEVTPENLHKWLKTYGDASANPGYREKLTTRYWLSQIQLMAQPFKEINKIQ